MARLTWHQHADLLLGGSLDETLRRWRAEGLTIDQVSRRLSDEHEIDVSRETVRQWLLALLPSEPEVRA